MHNDKHLFSFFLVILKLVFVILNLFQNLVIVNLSLSSWISFLSSWTCFRIINCYF